MIGLDYSALMTQVMDLLEYPPGTDPSSAAPSLDDDFNNIVPAMINDAEQRIYREIDFLNDRKENSTLSVVAGGRDFTVPADIVVVQSITLILPADPSFVLLQSGGLVLLQDGGALELQPQVTTPQNGTRVILVRVSVDAVNLLWPKESVTKAPVQNETYYAMLSATQALIAPTPDKAYLAEVTGVFRPTPMSPTNPTTYLGTMFPDLMLSACMMFGTTFQRDLGTASSDPKMSMSWEAIYQERKKSVLDEEARRRGFKTEGP